MAKTNDALRVLDRLTGKSARLRRAIANARTNFEVAQMIYDTRTKAGLTQREHEVLALLSKGHPDKLIAELLRLSTFTVHGHVRNIFEKLGVHNRVEAVVKYFQK